MDDRAAVKNALVLVVALFASASPASAAPRPAQSAADKRCFYIGETPNVGVGPADRQFLAERCSCLPVAHDADNSFCMAKGSRLHSYQVRLLRQQSAAEQARAKAEEDQRQKDVAAELARTRAEQLARMHEVLRQYAEKLATSEAALGACLQAPADGKATGTRCQVEAARHALLEAEGRRDTCFADPDRHECDVEVEKFRSQSPQP